jgi:chemotaxis protein histidine kinase CheA
MSIDMSQFYQVFFEEAAEHLASMESLLLELDIADPDAEQLNAIFRAAHSIKGSSGTFGFTDLQDVTHILENLLDRIRKGRRITGPNKNPGLAVTDDHDRFARDLDRRVAAVAQLGLDDTRGCSR